MRPSRVLNNHGRSLWWWSSRANRWANRLDEAFEGQWRRQEQLLNYRYAKAMRRRALWDKGPTTDKTSSHWPWPGPRWVRRLCADGDYIPTGTSCSGNHGRRTQLWSSKRRGNKKFIEETYRSQPTTFEEEFEAFKSQVDENPYEAIFGKKGNDSGSKNHFFSWFRHQPEEEQISQKHVKGESFVKDNQDLHNHEQPDRQDQNIPQNGNPKPCSFDKPVRDPETRLDFADDEYRYDPISMRKVRRQESSHTARTKVPPEDGQQRKAEEDRLDSTQSTFPESSNKAANDSPGCSNTLNETAGKETSAQTHNGHEHTDELFSGTTYETSDRVKDISTNLFNSQGPNGRSWLAKEGFGSDLPTSTEGSKDRLSVDDRIVPALDRVNAASVSDPGVSSRSSIKKREALERDYNSCIPEDGTLVSDFLPRKEKFQPHSIHGANRPPERDSLSSASAIAINPTDESGLSPVTPNDRTIKTTTNASSKVSMIETPEAMKEQDKAIARTLQMKQAAAAIEERERTVRFRDLKLARELKHLYEDHYGPISIEHHQVPSKKIVHNHGDSEIAQAATLNMQQDIAGTAKSERTVRFRDMKIAAKIRDLYEEHYGKIGQDANPVDTPDLQVKLAELSTSDPNPDLLNAAVRSHETSDIERLTEAIRKTTLEVDGLDNMASQRGKIVSDVTLAAENLEAFTAKARLTLQDVLPSTTSESDHYKQAPDLGHPVLYKILALDPLTGKMKLADTSSSMFDADEKVAHPADILSKLNNTAKFLPYFNMLQKQGYEVTTGSGDVLIFKRVRPPPSQESPDQITQINTITNSLTKQSSNNTVNDEVLQRKTENFSPIIRREEPVFSGGRNNERYGKPKTEKSSFETIKRVLLGGSITAALCYLIGAGTEILRGDAPPLQATRRPGIYSTEDSR